MIKFKFEGPMRVGFAAIGREVGPGEEFDVPEHEALAVAEHGHCTCLEPEKLAPLRAAEEAERLAQDAARAATGLVNAHPAAQTAEAAQAAPAGPPAAPVPGSGQGAEATPPAAGQTAEETPVPAVVKKRAAATSATAQ